MSDPSPILSRSPEAKAPAGIGSFDLAPLIAPFEGEGVDPGGESLLYDPLYDEIKALRKEDDATLPQGVWKRDLKRADWREVANRCVQGLSERSKDLQLAVWLVEAWGHRHGFAGLAQGLSFLTLLAAERWDDLHPRDEDDTPLRLALLGWLEGRLPRWLKAVPFTRPHGGESEVYGWRDWESGLYLANLAQSDRAAAEKAEAEGMTSQEKFVISVSLTPSQVYLTLASELEAIEVRLGEMVTVLAGRTDDEGPRFVKSGELVASMRRYVEKLLKERAAGDPSLAKALEGAVMTEQDDANGTSHTSEVDAAASPEVAGPEAGGDPAGAGPIKNRADAYRRLAEAADYLLRTEPHSPAPYLVKRAVSWGNMSAAEVYQELFVKASGQINLFDLLGIAPADGD